VEHRALGNTGLCLSLLGLGTGEWGAPDADEAGLARLLDRALDHGIDFVDTAPSYGCAEERLGRLLKGRGSRIQVCTKAGYGIPGVPDWTFECVRQGVDRALARLGRDSLDIVLLHSCPADVLEHNGVVDALEQARGQGKLRVVAYSGENEALDRALQDARIRCVMTSLNPCDQAVLDNPRLAAGLATGLGWLVKRPLANGVWRHTQPPERPDLAEYWRRWQALGNPGGADPLATCLGFAGQCAGPHAIVVGIRTEQGLQECLDALERGQAIGDSREGPRARWQAAAPGWPGLI
jgi:aryl-alcohol dehydrogenase-like predicted oxidoreductase